MSIQQKKKRLIQFILLGVIILISFSFLFIYAKQDNKKEPIGVSYIDHQPTLTSKHKDTEKKSSNKDDHTKEKDKETTSNQQEKQEEKVTSSSEQKETENNKTPQKQENSNTQKNESVKKEETPVKQPEVKTVTISIDMKNILDHKGEVNPRFQKFIPADGVLLAPMKMEIQEGDTVYDMLTRACEQQGIPLDAGSGYVKYINNIGEFDAGKSSGWLYTINGELCTIGSTQYQVKAGDVIAWRYTVKMGDV